MDDFRRPPRPQAPQPPRTTGSTLPVSPSPQINLADISLQEPLLSPPAVAKRKKSPKRLIMWVGVSIAALIGFVIGGVLVWYNFQLGAVDASNQDKKLVTIVSGTTPEGIATQLKGEGLIRDTTAFMWYTRIQRVQNALQAGTYRLSPSESTPKIVEHLTSGKVDTFNIRFLPGATLADNRKTLLGAGYSQSEVDQALAATYDSPLFEGKPASADLEGYIYGETYTFGTDTSVKAILEHIFEYYYGVIKENNLAAAYQAQKLSLYEGITLASIIQREASPGGDDMPQIAQVFYSRLAQGMPLGSDVTYQYIADKTGVPRDPNLNSPYNTRRFAGLPPGPIATPGKKALLAVANPAKGDYLYFLSGDDDVTYFARTLNEHEANIANHCKEKCKIL